MDRGIQISQHKILYKEESYAIQGAVFEVYKELGYGFLESVYQECLGKEFSVRGIPYVKQVDLPVLYKGEPVNLTYRVDFICYEKIMLELKAVQMIKNEHRAQLMNYLKISGLRLGLLINFGTCPRATVERIIL
jgi:GxxExxY protein